MIKNTVKRLPVNLIIPFLTEVSDNPLYQLHITDFRVTGGDLVYNLH